MQACLPTPSLIHPFVDMPLRTTYLWAKKSAQWALFRAPLLWLPHVHGWGRLHIEVILHSACGWISGFVSTYSVLLDLAAQTVMIWE